MHITLIKVSYTHAHDSIMHTHTHTHTSIMHFVIRCVHAIIVCTCSVRFHSLYVHAYAIAIYLAHLYSFLDGQHVSQLPFPTCLPTFYALAIPVSCYILLVSLKNLGVPSDSV